MEKDELAKAVQHRAEAAATADYHADPENPEGLSKSALKKLKKQEKAGKKNKMSKEEKEALFQGKNKGKKETKTVPQKKQAYVNKTPVGEKKDMSEPMADSYDPAAVESAWYDWWRKQGYFHADAKKAMNTVDSQKFVMCLPPPNVTGTLHLGHALMCCIEDCMTRWHRMMGHQTLWIPGTDHAGIATQSVVENLLLRDEGLSRHDLGREKFLEKVWEWKNEKGDTICKQMERLASSLDWDRQFFTMDDNLSTAVKEAFVRFYDEGKIYRDTRLVNWCPYLRTALSDLEVDHIDIEKRTLLSVPGLPDAKVEVGVLVEFKYPLKEDPTKFVHIATTRLETMLGDVAVAVNPKDTRFTYLVGKELVHPFIPDRKMVVIEDDYVSMDFGTGCVKITPAHDPNDFAIGRRHNLPEINILNDDGTMNENCGEFAGQHRFVARRTVEERLKELGLFVGKTDNAMKVPLCSKSKDIVEPVLKPQWWMDCSKEAARGVQAVKEGKLKIEPSYYESTWFNWLENIRDWCISRQLWWGHRIPAYKVVKPCQTEDQWVVGRDEEEALLRAAEKLGIPESEIELAQDPDVLDTWFSSGLLPMSALGWPNMDTDDMKAFFPTSVLETGHDILFFWVARMVMMSLALTDELPFHTICLHAMVRDAHGRKMSKSLGNVIDPLEVMSGISLPELQEKLKHGNLPEREIKKAMKGQEKDFPDGIPECGSDALRFGLLAYTGQARSVNLDINRVVSYRYFCNKLWNVMKFALPNFGDNFKSTGLPLDAKLELSDAAGAANRGIKDFSFSDATTATYNFWLYDFCDYYLELVKKRFRALEGTDSEELRVAREVLYICLDRGLRLLHPLLPFVTEELYQRIPDSVTKAESIVVADYPQPVMSWRNLDVEEEMAILQTTTSSLRSQAASLGLPPKARPHAYIRAVDPEARRVLPKIADHVATMAKLSSLKVIEDASEVPAGTIANVVSEHVTTFMEVAGLVDLSAELKKIEKKMGITQHNLQTYVSKREVPDYEEKVPPQVRHANAAKEESYRAELAEQEKVIAQIKAAMESTA
ncbi:hypothetical protein FOL47_000561 [Perkinsus chesapeaki]|uniref:Valine--tRNA ligase, mitochondrial n=1 Tax=Perkinsus chesapeaki TaxID=330153 RepID=A0A7J6N1K2_PERCH|nr:hypothetical protein FOL47_000561 [Perkinsus chesapeaki]